MTAATAPRRRATVVAALAAGTLALTGCSMTSPTTTKLQYAPADGVLIDGDAFDVRDLLVVSQGNGAPGVVSGTVVNSTDEPLEVTVQVAGAGLEPAIEVPARQAGPLAPTGGEALTVPGVETPAGQSVEVRLSANGETLSAVAPVLLPQGQYADFADQAGGEVKPAADEAATTSEH